MDISPIIVIPMESQALPLQARSYSQTSENLETKSNKERARILQLVLQFFLAVLTRRIVKTDGEADMPSEPPALDSELPINDILSKNRDGYFAILF